MAASVAFFKASAAGRAKAAPASTAVVKPRRMASTRESVQPVTATCSLTVFWSSTVVGDVRIAVMMFDAAWLVVVVRLDVSATSPKRQGRMELRNDISGVQAREGRCSFSET